MAAGVTGATARPSPRRQRTPCAAQRSMPGTFRALRRGASLTERSRWRSCSTRRSRARRSASARSTSAACGRDHARRVVADWRGPGATSAASPAARTGACWPRPAGALTRDGSIVLWDVATREEVARMREQKDSVLSVAFSPNGRRSFELMPLAHRRASQSTCRLAASFLLWRDALRSVPLELAFPAGAIHGAEADTARRFGGTGLELALSREFCRMMVGDIAVDSEQGTGSTFTIRLPATVPPPPPT